MNWHVTTPVLSGTYEGCRDLPVSGNIAVEGVVSLIGGHEFSPDSHILVTPGSQLRSLGAIKAGEVYCDHAGEYQGKPDPGFVILNSTAKDHVNDLMLYWDKQTKHHTSDYGDWQFTHMGGKTVTLDLDLMRFSRAERVQEYKENTWYVQDALNRVRIPVAVALSVNEAQKTVRIVLTFSGDLPAGKSRWWTCQPKAFLKGVQILKVHGKGCINNVMSAYGLDGTFDDKKSKTFEVIESYNYGLDCVTLEMCRNVTVGHFEGGGNHQKFSGDVDLNFVDYSEGCKVVSSKGSVIAQPRNCPALYNEGVVVKGGGMVASPEVPV